MALTERKFLNDEESEVLTKLLDRYKDKTKTTKTEYRDSLLLRLASKTSGRGIEVLSILPTDLGNESVTVPGAKGSNSRTVPLPVDLFRELKDYCQDLPPDKPIFSMSTRHFRRIWAQYRPNHIKGSHALRHTGALKLYLNCRDIKAVQQYLGQKNIHNTMIYLDFVEGTHRLRSHMKGMWNQKFSS